MAAAVYRVLGYLGGGYQLTGGHAYGPNLQGAATTPVYFWKLIRGLLQTDQTVTPYRDANTRDTTFMLKERLSGGKGTFQTFFYPKEGGALLAWALGADGLVGTGSVVGQGRTGRALDTASNTIGAVAAGAATMTMTIVGGGDTPTTGSTWQIDVNGAGTTAELVTLGTVSGPGPYTCPLATGTEFAYSHLIGATVTHVATPYTHPIVLQDNLPWITMEMATASQQLVERVTDCKVVELLIEATTGKPVMITGTVMGIVPAVQGSASTVTFTDGASQGPANFTDGAITITGGPSDAATMQAQVAKWSLKISQNAKEILADGSLTPIWILEQNRTFELTIDAIFSSASAYELAYYGANNATGPGSGASPAGGVVGTITSFVSVFGVNGSANSDPQETLSFFNINVTKAQLSDVNPNAAEAHVILTCTLTNPAGATHQPAVVSIKNDQLASYTPANNNTIG